MCARACARCFTSAVAFHIAAAVGLSAPWTVTAAAPPPLATAGTATQWAEMMELLFLFSFFVSNVAVAVAETGGGGAGGGREGRMRENTQWRNRKRREEQGEKERQRGEMGRWSCQSEKV